MARSLRIQYPGAWYHIMNRGGYRRVVFLNDSDRSDFLRLLGETIEMWSIEVHAYALMNTHYHLLIHTPRGNISRAMRHIDGVYTQRYNLRHKLDGHLFRGRYKSILVDQDTYLLEIIRYIHLQAVRASFVRRPEDYRWSSHRAYLFNQENVLWLSTSKIYSMFSKREKDARRRMDEFVNKGLPPEVEQFYSKQRLAPFLGSEKFIQKIKDTYISPARESYEIPDSKIKSKRRSVDIINSAVCEHYVISPSLLRATAKGIPNRARDVAVYLARKTGGYSLNEIAGFYNFSNYSGVNSTIRRMEQRLITNNELVKIINKLKEIVSEHH